MSVLEIAKISSKSFLVNDGLINITRNTIDVLKTSYGNYSRESVDRNNQNLKNRDIINVAIDLAINQIKLQVPENDYDYDFSSYYDQLENFKTNGTVVNLNEIENHIKNFNNKSIEIKRVYHEEVIMKKIREERYKNCVNDLNILFNEYKDIEYFEEIKKIVSDCKNYIFKSDSQKKTELLINDFLKYKNDIKENLLKNKQLIKVLNSSESTMKMALNSIKNDGILNSFSKDFTLLEDKMKEFSSINSLVKKMNSINNIETLYKKFNLEHNIGKSISLDGIIEDKIIIKKKEDKKTILLKEIKKYCDELRVFDKNSLNSLDNLIDESKGEKIYTERLSLIRDQIKLSLYNTKENYKNTSLYKSILKGQIELLKIIDKSQFAYILEQQIISKLEFETVNSNIEEILKKNGSILEEKTKEDFVTKLAKQLENMGYKVDTEEYDYDSILGKLFDNEEVHFDTEFNEYKIRVKINENNQLITRMIKYVEEGKVSASSYEKQKEEEVVKKWCKNYDNLLIYFAENGIDLDVTLRKEHYEVDMIQVSKQNNQTKKSNSKSLEFIKNR